MTEGKPTSVLQAGEGRQPTLQQHKPVIVSNKAQQTSDNLSLLKQSSAASEILRDTDVHPPLLLGGEHDGVREMRLSLARFAKRHKSYPLLASQSGWEGRVEISLVVLPAGLPIFDLRKSSGFEVLDNEALRLVEKAFRQALIPASLRSQAFEILLPIEFRLE
ncbi:MAG: hypothetical protein RIR18_2341 [Pseudomonadota bacterium]